MFAVSSYAKEALNEGCRSQVQRKSKFGFFVQQAVDVYLFSKNVGAALTLHRFKERLHNLLDEKLSKNYYIAETEITQKIPAGKNILLCGTTCVPYIHALFLLFPAQLLGNPAGDKPWG